MADFISESPADIKSETVADIKSETVADFRRNPQINRSAGLRAINRQIVEADAQGDQQLASLQIKTYSQASPIRSPAPINSVMPAAPVMGANVGQLVTGLAGAVTSGISNYSTMSKQPFDKTVSQIGSWASRQFQVAPAKGA